MLIGSKWSSKVEPCLNNLVHLQVELKEMNEVSVDFHVLIINT